VNVLDLCGGIGVLGRAFELEGFDVVAAWELDDERASCYEQNTDATCNVADVTDLDAADLAAWSPPNQTVVIGGIPCQTYSQANNNAEHDTTLRDAVLELVDAYDPVATALENVMLGWSGIDPVTCVRDCHVGGFTIRERGFYGLHNPPPRTHGDPGQARLDGQPLEPMHGWAEALPGDENLLADFQQQDAYVNRNRLPVLPGYEPGYTLTSKSVNGFLLWDEANRSSIRWLDTDDMAQLHGMDPDKWSFPGTKTATAAAIGDNVPLAMGRAVARQLRRQIPTIDSEEVLDGV